MKNRVAGMFKDVAGVGFLFVLALLMGCGEEKEVSPLGGKWKTGGVGDRDSGSTVSGRLVYTTDGADE